jgi:aspartate/methionine/tyrosine aminotransferase
MSFSTADHLNSIKKSEIRKLIDQAPADAVNLGLGELKIPLPAYLRECARQIAAQNDFRYTPNAGLIELRKSVSDYYSIDYKENVCITIGAEEAIFTSLFAYLNPGDEVLIADPYFVAYPAIISMLKAKTAFFPLPAESNFSFDKTSFLKSISPATKIILINNPINPTGTVYSQEDLLFIADFCHTRKILLIVDEVYRELYFKKKLPSILDYSEEAISISSLSKSHSLSGLRLGWAAARSQEVIEPIIRAHQYICTCASSFSQYLALKALDQKGSLANLEIRQLLSNKRDYVVQHLKNYVDSNHHPYLFLKVDDEEMVMKELLRRKIIVIPGSVFGNNSRNWLRLNFAVDDADLLKAIPIIKEIILPG